MRPESSKSTTMKVLVNQDQLKNTRKSLHVLQPAAGDKENLVGPGRSSHTSAKDNLIKGDMSERNEKNILITEKIIEQSTIKNNVKKKKISNKLIQTEKSLPSIELSDLTEEVPSEKYWEVLAEKRREALFDALTENEQLHKKIDILEKQITIANEKLKEATEVVEVLKEIIAEVHPDSGDEYENPSSDVDNREQS